MSKTTVETATPETAEAYLAFWNTRPADGQRDAGRALFTEDVRYVTPVGVRSGTDALVEFTAQFLDGVGEYELLARSAPDLHHDRVRVPWEIRVGGRSFAEGTDILVTDESGRVTEVAAFLDRAPEGFAAEHDRD